MFGKKKGDNPSDDSAAVKNRETEEARELQETLSKIKHTYVVLSGKGGVGKSTVAVNLAVTLSEKGFAVGLLDVDVHGPSIPTLLGITDKHPVADENGKMVPVVYHDSLKVISIGFLLQRSEDAVIWRGPLKYGVIKQFIKDVAWGELDYLIIDSPPGTGDEPLSVCQLIGGADGALIVTTPQDLALVDVRKSITFCRKLNMPVAGVIENMSGFVCPHCGKSVDIFKSGGGMRMAEEMGVPFLGSIPIDVAVARTSDSGKPFVTESSDDLSGTRRAFDTIVEKLVKKNGGST
jgi:ATP-binding protein involved in chromosome partitioning